MKDKLYIIVDSSGSMFEMAKYSISMNLLFTIRDFNKFNQEFNEISLFFWNREVNEVDFVNTDDFMSFTASGKLNFETLKEKLILINEEDKDIKILFLSDGNYENSKFNDFCNYVENRSNIYIVPIHIGADSSIDKLKSISFNGYVYGAEDVLTAIKSFNYIFKEMLVIPISIDDIQMELSDKEEVDEW